MPGERAPRDHSGSRAVLIGTWDYEHLPPVPAAQHSLRRMTDLLTSPVCGWPADRIETVANRARPGDLYDDLVELYSQTDPDGVALFYFVGHGQPDSDDRLCLGLAGSRTEAARRASTSLLFDNVRDALRQSDAGTKVVILDCCFAGLAAANRLSGGDFLDMVRGTGAYTMAASGAYSPAWFEVDENIREPQTFFTKYFADVVEAGIPHQQAVLPLDVIFATAADRLVRDGKPKPTSTVRHEAGRLAFARNLAPAADPVDHQAEVSRLTAELEAARARAEELAARNLESEREIRRLVSSRRDDLSVEKRREVDDRLESLTRWVNDNASETALALGDRERARHALVEAAPELQAAPAATGHEWDDVESAASTLPVADVLRRITELVPQAETATWADEAGTDADANDQDRAVQRILLSGGLRPVPELAELAIGLKRADRDADARTMLRYAAHRPAAEIAELVRLLRASPVPVPERRPLLPLPTAGRNRTTDDFFADATARHEEFFRRFDEGQPLSYAVLAAAAVRPAADVAAVATALAGTGAEPEDVRYLLECAGWQNSAAQIAELVDALRAAGRDGDAVIVLERAGGRPADVVAELIRTAAARNRDPDIEIVLRGKPSDPRNAAERRTLTEALERTSLDPSLWRPMVKDQTSRWTGPSHGFDWWLGPALARFVPYSVAALLIGLGLSQHSADPGLGSLDWLAVAASAALLLLAARLVYWAVAERIWGMSRVFHDGSDGLLVAAMVACFLVGFFLLPLAGADPVGVVLRDWMAWRF